MLKRRALARVVAPLAAIALAACSTSQIQPQRMEAVAPALEGFHEAGQVSGGSLLPDGARVARVLAHDSGGPTLLLYEDVPRPYAVVANELVLSVPSGDSVGQLEAAVRHIEGLGPDFSITYTPGSKLLLVRRASSIALSPSALLEMLRLPAGIVVTAQPNLILRLESNQDLLNPQAFDPPHEQWALDNMGEFANEATVADADADGAEALVTLLRSQRDPAEPVLVGIIDSGINVAHPALADALWTNPGEVPDNGRDDDGNGYVDDVHGWNFAENNGILHDATGHGTHVAGIVAARPRSDGRGTYGIAQNARILVAKIALKGTNQTSTFAAARAVEYVVAQKAVVVNMSFSSDVDTPALREAIWDAARKDSTMFVASAGNEGRDLGASPTFPCAYGTLTCVASTSALDSLSTFSNHGGWAQGNYLITIAAPGENINSTKYYAYEPMSGTSMAAPLVAGTFAALAGMYPDETSTDRRPRVYGNADRLRSLDGKVGQGRRLNIYHAMFSPVDTVLVEGTDVTPYCEATIRRADGVLTKRRENVPYANSGEAGVDGTSLPRAFRICSARQLAGMWDADSAKVFSLAQHVYWDSTLYPVFGQPRYDSPAPTFVGKLYGNGFSVRNLVMNRPSPYGGGLFLSLGRGAEVSDLDLRGVDIRTNGSAGALARTSEGTINDVSVEGRIRGGDGVGGLVGVMRGGHVAGGYFSGTVDGTRRVGGIAGQVGLRGGRAATIHFAHVRGEINGDLSGGIAGDVSFTSSIVASYARVLQRTGATVGGLAGQLSCGARIEQSYAQGKITGSAPGGGIVGRIMNAHVGHSYSSIFFTSPREHLGGAIGQNMDGMTVTVDGTWRYVCTGNQTAPTPSKVTQVLYDSVLGGTASDGGVAQTTTALRKLETFGGWFGGGSPWRHVPGYMPVLNGLPRSVRVH